jgi:hypothetical protein
MSITDIYLDEGCEIDEIDIDPDYYDEYDEYDEDVATIENAEEHDFAFYDSVGVSSY